MFRTCLRQLSLVAPLGLLLTTLCLTPDQYLPIANAEEPKSSHNPVAVDNSRQFLVRDVDLNLKSDRKLKLMAGTSVEVTGQDDDLIHLQVLGEDVSISADHVALKKIAESQLRIRALVPSPQNMRPWGRFLLEENRYREAVEIWRKIADRSESDPQDLYLWAMSCIETQQWESALKPLDRLFDLKPTLNDDELPLTGVSWSHLHSLQGMCHLRNGRPILALRDLLAASRTQPDILSNRLLLFETFLSLNRFEEALEQERQITILSENDPALMQQLDQQVWTLCGLIINQLNSSQRTLMENSQFPLLLSSRTPSTFKQAELGVRALGSLHLYEASNEFLGKARKQFPESVELLFLDGVSAAIQGEFSRASGIFDEVIKQFPEHQNAYKNRASIHYQNGEFEKSARDYLMIANLNPENIDAWYSLSLCQLKMGQVGEAITLLEMITETHPTYYRPWNLLAWTYATYPEESSRNGNAAVLCALRANELSNFNEADFLDTLAAAYAEAGQFDQAISTQIDAIDKLRTTPQRSEFLSRLEMYRQNEPFREDPRHGDYR